MTTLGRRSVRCAAHPYSDPVLLPGTRSLRRVPATAACAATLAVVLALSAASCSTGSQATDGPRLISGARPANVVAPASGSDPTGMPTSWSPQPLQWSTCKGHPGSAAGMRCATLRVPLDWSDPAGEQIDLAVAKVPASGGADERLGTIVTNPGGPGGSGVAFVASNPFGGELALRFDQVSWDPRGVGASTAVTCGETAASAFLHADPDPDTAAEQATLDQLARAVSDDCAMHDADLLAHVGTSDVARDLEALRLAIGDGPINYVGFSYGTQIGQLYAEMFPTGVRSMVLDGVVDPSLGFTEFLIGQVEGFEAAFAEQAAACAKETDACGVADLSTAYDRVKERVERDPLPASAGPGTGSSAGRSVGPAELATAAIYTGYRTDGWRDLGPALATALDGDGSGLASLSDGYHDLGGYAAYAGVVCSDTPPPADPTAWKAFADQARARSPRFGGSIANELLPCATWPVRSAQVPAAVDASVASDAPPVLVVGNTGDPATPLSNARSVAGRMRSAVLVTVDIDGHTAYGRDRCATKVIDAYLLSLTLPAGPTICPPG